MTTDKARAEAEAIMWRHALQPEHGRRFIPDPEAMTAAIAAALTARDAEAEGLREAVRVLGERVAAMEANRVFDEPNAHASDCRKHYDLMASTESAVLANPIAKAALDAAGGA